MTRIRQAAEVAKGLNDIPGLALGAVSFAFGLTIHILIPHHVSLEPIPGASQYVLFTPAAVPRACATAFVLLGILQVFYSLRAAPPAAVTSDVPTPAGAAPLDLAVLGLALVGYATLMVELGYGLATGGFLLLLLLYGGERSPINLAICCIGVPAAVYGLFAWLMSIPLPEGRLLE